MKRTASRSRIKDHEVMGLNQGSQFLRDPIVDQRLGADHDRVRAGHGFGKIRGHKVEASLTGDGTGGRQCEIFDKSFNIAPELRKFKEADMLSLEAEINGARFPPVPGADHGDGIDHKNLPSVF
jgi:hypothetical protein